jgi:hypothetical protein
MVSKICGEEQQYFFVVYRFDIVGQNSVHELGRHTSIDEVQRQARHHSRSPMQSNLAVKKHKLSASGPSCRGCDAKYFFKKD